MRKLKRTMTAEQKTALIRWAIAALIALLAIFGVDASGAVDLPVV